MMTAYEIPDTGLALMFGVLSLYPFVILIVWWCFIEEQEPTKAWLRKWLGIEVRG